MKKDVVIRSAILVGLLTGLSRAFGLARDMLMARIFGTTLIASAFEIAFLVPNLFRRLFGEGALSVALVPVLTDALQKEGEDSARLLTRRMLTMTAMGLSAVAAVGVIASAIALRFLPEDTRAYLVLSYLRITFPYMVFICLAGVCMAVLNSLGHFAMPAAAPILLNVVEIAVLALVCPLLGPSLRERAYAVAWGVLVAGLLQVAVQVPAMARRGFAPRMAFGWADPHMARVLRLMLPAVLGMGVFQVNVLVDRLLAMWAADWAPAALMYAERLVYMPLGLIGTSLGTVLLPAFSQHAARSEADGMRQTLNYSLRTLLLATVPASCGLLVLAAPLTRLIYEGGEFGASSTLQTARALTAYAPGLIVFGMYKVLVPVFYSLKDTRTPVRVAACMVLLNFSLNLTSVLTLPQDYRHVGIALATVVSSAVNCIVLGVILHRRLGSPGWGTIAGAFARIAVASAVMGVVVVVAHGSLSSALGGGGEASKVAQLIAVLGAVAVGLASYACLAAVMCRKESMEIISALGRRKTPSGINSGDGAAG